MVVVPAAVLVAILALCTQLRPPVPWRLIGQQTTQARSSSGGQQRPPSSDKEVMMPDPGAKAARCPAHWSACGSRPAW